MGTMAAAVGGSIIGNGISSMMFNREQPPQSAEQVQQVAQQTPANDACAPYLNGFSQCMRDNGENADACKYAWSGFMTCKEQNGPKMA